MFFMYVYYIHLQLPYRGRPISLYVRSSVGIGATTYILVNTIPHKVRIIPIN
ncbi:hypothetical protein SAMN04487776_10957 [Priestia megaterium]|nr:hypothetical protein SAMN04487776_10957 [Priestia megaterium]